MPLPILGRHLSPLLLVLLLAATPLKAHDGHEHGETASQSQAPAPASVGAGRATAQSESFELVAVAHEHELLIYVDRFADNSPFDGAQLEVESGNWQAKAEEIEPGTYRVMAPLLAVPGQHNLLFTLTKGQEADLLETTVSVANETLPDLTPTRVYSQLLLPVGLALAAVLLFIWWRQRRRGSE